MSVYVEWLVLLIAAAAVGVVLGLPSAKQPGGVRTHALVVMGSLLFCETGQVLAPDGTELMRVIQGVATGVGFIGGAAVIKYAGTTRGVNASASIWIAAALGCLLAFVPAPQAAVVAIGVAVLNFALSVIEDRVFARRRHLPHDVVPHGAASEHA